MDGGFLREVAHMADLAPDSAEAPLRAFGFVESGVLRGVSWTCPGFHRDLDMFELNSCRGFFLNQSSLKGRRETLCRVPIPQGL